MNVPAAAAGGPADVKLENRPKKLGTADDADGADIGGHRRYQRSKMSTAEALPT
jgi:hypothetical protein